MVADLPDQIIAHKLKSHNCLTIAQVSMTKIVVLMAFLALLADKYPSSMNKAEIVITKEAQYKPLFLATLLKTTQEVVQ